MSDERRTPEEERAYRARQNGHESAAPIESRACYGLTKREHFAAMAMQGLISCPTTSGDYEAFAKHAVRYADALLLALESPQ